MGRALSQDLRDRVIDAALGGMSARSAAARFGIGISTAIAWVARARNGDRRAWLRGGRRGSKLDAHRAFLLRLIEETPDMTLAEMRARLADERQFEVGTGTLWAYLDRAGLRHKKRARMLRNRTARMF